MGNSCSENPARSFELPAAGEMKPTERAVTNTAPKTQTTVFRDVSMQWKYNGERDWKRHARHIQKLIQEFTETAFCVCRSEWRTRTSRARPSKEKTLIVYQPISICRQLRENFAE